MKTRLVLPRILCNRGKSGCSNPNEDPRYGRGVYMYPTAIYTNGESRLAAVYRCMACEHECYGVSSPTGWCFWNKALVDRIRKGLTPGNTLEFDWRMKFDPRDDRARFIPDEDEEDQSDPAFD